MKKIFVLALALFSFSSFAKSELYFVEPMICKGQINKLPKHMHTDYETAAVKVISFWSIRKKDCTMAPSSSSQSDYAPVGEELKINEDIEIGGWFDGPLTVDGTTVTAPHSVWPGPMELEIVDTKTEDDKRTDTLKGRYNYSKGYYYNLTCTATVVDSPSYVQNDTKNCN